MPKMLKGELENDSKQPRYLLKNRLSDNPKKSQLILTQGMAKKGDDDHDVDDEVRTTVQS